MKRVASSLTFPVQTNAQVAEPGPVWIRLATAAALVDTTPKALSMRLSRTNLPQGILRHWGRTVLLHRTRFLAWLESGPTS